MARSGTLLNRLTKIYRVIYSRTILHLTWHCFIAKASSLLTKALNKESAIQYLTAVDNPTSLRCISLGTNCRVFFHMSGHESLKDFMRNRFRWVSDKWKAWVSICTIAISLGRVVVNRRILATLGLDTGYQSSIMTFGCATNSQGWEFVQIIIIFYYSRNGWCLLLNHLNTPP